MEGMRPRWLPVVEGVAVTVFSFLMISLVVRFADALRGLKQPWILLLAIPMGYLAADFASGLAHWLCDNFFEENSPLIGRMLIHPFREHHRDPFQITRHGFLELTGNSCLALNPPLAAVWWAEGPAAGDLLSLFGYATLLSWSLALAATNQFHRWAHDASVARPVAWMQKCRLILSPSHHAAHHQPPHSRAYCITSGWMNFLTDRLELFRWGETRRRRKVAAAD